MMRFLTLFALIFSFNVFSETTYCNCESGSDGSFVNQLVLRDSGDDSLISVVSNFDRVWVNGVDRFKEPESLYEQEIYDSFCFELRKRHPYCYKNDIKPKGQSCVGDLTILGPRLSISSPINIIKIGTRTVRLEKGHGNVYSATYKDDYASSEFHFPSILVHLENLTCDLWRKDRIVCKNELKESFQLFTNFHWYNNHFENGSRVTFIYRDKSGELQTLREKQVWNCE